MRCPQNGANIRQIAANYWLNEGLVLRTTVDGIAACEITPIESTRFIAKRYAPRSLIDCEFLYQKINRRFQRSSNGV
jgi:hypothetical protein